MHSKWIIATQSANSALSKTTTKLKAVVPQATKPTLKKIMKVYGLNTPTTGTLVPPALRAPIVTSAEASQHAYFIHFKHAGTYRVKGW